MDTFLGKFIKKNWLATTFFSIFLILLIIMTYMGTLSYPYIMAQRQVQMYKYCKDSKKDFLASDFSFTFKVPDGFCFLPNRQYPKDTTIQVLPKGLYFVLNEYIEGTVISNTRATIIFEPVTLERNIDSILIAMNKGGFLKGSKREDFVNKNRVRVVLVRGTSGLDPEEKSDWAFVLNKNGNVLLSLLLNKPESPEVFNYIVENLDTN